MMNLKRVLFTIVFLLLVAAPVAAQSDATIYATAQRFENGLMIWRSDTAFIWVLGNNGQVLNFPASSYTPLPDNPVFGDPPSRLRPIFGFGKVWGNNVEVRGLLGWPTLPELGFNMPIRYANRTYYLTQLDGSVIQINPNNTWTRTPDNPPLATARILSFTVSPQQAAPGGAITVNWNVENAELVLLEAYTDGSAVPFNLIQELPTAGSASLTVPSTVVSEVRVVIWGAYHRRGYSPVTMYERVVHSSLTIPLQAAPPASTTVQAAYQPYQRGFMIWRSDTGEVYMFASDNSRWAAFPQSTYEGLPDNSIVAPSGFVTSVRGFGRVWGSFEHVRDTLGWATGSEQGYQLSISSRNGTPFAYSLPDPNRIITFDALGNYSIVNFVCGATAGC
jgi:hypothetical protein